MAIGAGAIRAAKAFVEILADDSQARRVLRQFQGRMQQFATTMNSLGRAMLLPAIGVGLALGKTTRVFSEFEKEMSKVKARLDATDAGFEKLKKAAIEFGKTTAFSATEAARAMTNFAEAGYDSARIATIMAPAINLAAAGMMELSEASDVIITTLNAFNLRAEDIPHVVDTIASASVESASDVRELSQSFVYASTVASVAGTRLEDLVGVLSLLHDSGIKADIAGTSVRGMLLSLTSPSEKAAETMRQLGVQIQDMRGNMLPMASIIDQFKRATASMGTAQRLNIVGNIFDTRQAAAFAKLLDIGGDKIRDRIDLIANDTGRAASVAKTQLDNLAGDFKRLMGTFESFQITITEAIAEPLRGITVGLRNVIGIVNEWAKENPGLVRTIVGLSAALAVTAPLLILASVGMKLLAFAVEPVLAGMTALRMTVGATGVVMKALGSLTTSVVIPAFMMLGRVLLMGLVPALRLVGLALLRIQVAFALLIAKGVTAALVSIVSAVASLSSLLVPLVFGFAMLVSPVGLATAAVIGIGVALVAVGAYIVYASGAWGRMVRTMSETWTRFTADAKAAWKILTAALQTGRFDLAFKAITILMKIAWLEAVDFMMTNWEEFRDFVIDYWDEAVTNVTVGILRIQEAFENTVKTVRGKWEEFFNWLEGKEVNRPEPVQRPDGAVEHRPAKGKHFIGPPEIPPGGVQQHFPKDKPFVKPAGPPGVPGWRAGIGGGGAAGMAANMLAQAVFAGIGGDDGAETGETRQQKFERMRQETNERIAAHREQRERVLAQARGQGLVMPGRVQDWDRRRKEFGRRNVDSLKPRDFGQNEPPLMVEGPDGKKIIIGGGARGEPTPHPGAGGNARWKRIAGRFEQAKKDAAEKQARAIQVETEFEEGKGKKADVVRANFEASSATEKLGKMTEAFRGTAERFGLPKASEQFKRTQEEADRTRKMAEEAEKAGPAATAAKSKLQATKKRKEHELAKGKYAGLLKKLGVTPEQMQELGLAGVELIQPEKAGGAELARPASLQAADEEVLQARKKVGDPNLTQEQQAVAEKELRHAERVQAREQRKFEAQKKKADLRKELDDSRREAENLLATGGKNFGLGQRFGGMMGDMLSGAKSSVQGTFSGIAASGLGAGTTSLDRIAMYSEQTAKNTKDLKSKDGTVFT